MSDPALYQALARYNRVMNEKLYGVCATMTDDERKADKGAFFKSIHGTLNHLLHGDLAWMTRIAGVVRDLPEMGTLIHDDFDELRADREALDREIEEWCAGLSSAWLATELRWTAGIDGIERVQPHWLLVSTLFNHQTHHRGQISTLLTQAGYDLGVTDLPRV